MNTTNGNLFLISLDDFSRLEVQFVPLDISMGRTATLPEMAVVGRNHPDYQYTGGKDALSLDLDFHASEENKEDVITKVQWLTSLAASDGYDGPAPNVKLVWGSLFTNEVWLVQSVQTNLSLFDQANGYLPRQAYVKLNLVRDTSTNLTWTDYRR